MHQAASSFREPHRRATVTGGHHHCRHLLVVDVRNRKQPWDSRGVSVDYIDNCFLSVPSL
ncbi:hypothetical protein LINPERPRIM_LOCUS17411 [Linum perenne]